MTPNTTRTTYHSMEDMDRFMKKVWKGVDKLIDGLDEKALTKQVSAAWLPGEHRLADVLMQVTMEQAHHLGEMICLLWQIDVEPPEMIWIMNTRRRKR
jgi:uncharacterized damage-inducible protein DinB